MSQSSSQSRQASPPFLPRRQDGQQIHPMHGIPPQGRGRRRWMAVEPRLRFHRLPFWRMPQATHVRPGVARTGPSTGAWAWPHAANSCSGLVHVRSPVESPRTFPRDLDGTAAEGTWMAVGGLSYWPDRAPAPLDATFGPGTHCEARPPAQRLGEETWFTSTKVLRQGESVRCRQGDTTDPRTAARTLELSVPFRRRTGRQRRRGRCPAQARGHDLAPGSQGGVDGLLGALSRPATATFSSARR